jgi:hypothetical protein
VISVGGAVIIWDTLPEKPSQGGKTWNQGAGFAFSRDQLLAAAAARNYNRCRFIPSERAGSTM